MIYIYIYIYYMYIICYISIFANLQADNETLTYDLNGFKSRANRNLLSLSFY